ncbi:TLC domain-containing protein 4 isoform X3 [Struthio camelus]|uniref:TLC domain-containing protein 4 isoform X3 n=1 Tax=Struthio camelus TaxID=8801 RepID=UPI00051E1523|nr:PREDICTED: transmembrane protein 56 isoform X3 [Struthio camelus australis]
MASFSNLTIGITVASFAVFQVLFHVLSSWVSTRITPGFNNLSQKRKIEWNSRTVSTFHALVVGVFCLYILLYDEAVNADHIWGDPSIVKLNIAITTGYLISDLLLIIYYWKAIGDKFFVIHHLAALYAYYFVLSKGLLAYFGNFRLLAEFSTPFVNQRLLYSFINCLQETSQGRICSWVERVSLWKVSNSWEENSTSYSVPDTSQIEVVMSIYKL